MDTHKNARLTPKGREEMVRAVVDRGMSKAVAARQFNTTPKIVGKWVGRFCAEGVDGLRDRSSRPLSSPSQIPLATADAVENLRRKRRTQEHIAAEIGISKASVSRILKRRGLSRLSSLELQEPHPRYEREKPGEIIHLDIKKLGRFSSVGHRVTGRRTGYCSSQGAGWEFVHVAIDDHSRIARAEIFPDQKKESAVAFLVATVAYFRSLGITVERVMTDNGSCYLSKAFARACKQLAVKHIRIKPYTPQTNGKAERFIQTALREWAYATAFEHSEQRYAALPAWLHRYNWHRPHVSLARKPPISRLGLTEDNLLRLHSERAAAPLQSGASARFRRPDAGRFVQRRARHIPAHDLGTVAIKAAVDHAKVAAEELDEVILGQSPHLDACQHASGVLPSGPGSDLSLGL